MMIYSEMSSSFILSFEGEYKMGGGGGGGGGLSTREANAKPQTLAIVKMVGK